LVGEQRGGDQLVVVAGIPLHRHGGVRVAGGVLLHRLLDTLLAVLVIPLAELGLVAAGGAGGTGLRAAGVRPAGRQAGGGDRAGQAEKTSSWDCHRWTLIHSATAATEQLHGERSLGSSP